MNRRLRPFVALLALLALVFAQAMASVHACDGQAFGTADAKAAAADSDAQSLLNCCDEEHPAQKPLCDSHCQQGKQTLDRGQAPSLPAVVAIGFAVPLIVTGTDVASAPPAVRPPSFARITEPPISIRNCCFRI